MKSKMVVILAAVLLAVAAALVATGDKPTYTMVNVGGTKNQCECTYRLER